MNNDVTGTIPPQPAGPAAERNGAALAHLYRALRSYSLYPEGHPLRSDALQRAHQALLELVHELDLALSISRTGFVTTDGGSPVSPTPMTQALATELFIRRIKRLAILRDVTLFDLQKFLRLLTLPPDKVEAEGGMESLMAERHIKSIWANEIDLSTIYEKRDEMASGEEFGMEAFTPPTEAGFALPDDELQDASLDDILTRMSQEADDDRYRKLSEMLLNQAQALRDQNQSEPLLPAVFFLNREEHDDGRSEAIRNTARDTLALLLSADVTEFLLDLLSSPHARNQPSDTMSERITTLCVDHWELVATQVMERYLSLESTATRAALTTLYIRVGKKALPPLLPLLNSEEWPTVLAVLMLVGEIGGKEYVSSLTSVVFHPNIRVRRETIRTLARIGGEEAETALIDLLTERDQTLKLQAILSLGVMQSRSAVTPLLGILNQNDLFLENLQIKKESAQALGRIGDRQATPHLLKVLTKGRFIARKGWQELRMSVAGALGIMGDPAALEPLRGLAHHSDKLGKCCSEAADLLERRLKNQTI